MDELCTFLTLSFLSFLSLLLSQLGLSQLPLANEVVFAPVFSSDYQENQKQSDVKDDTEADTADNEPSHVASVLQVVHPVCKGQKWIGSDQNRKFIQYLYGIGRRGPVRLLATNVGNDEHGAENLEEHLEQGVSGQKCQDQEHQVAPHEEHRLVVQRHLVGSVVFEELLVVDWMRAVDLCLLLVFKVPLRQPEQDQGRNEKRCKTCEGKYSR